MKKCALFVVCVVLAIGFCWYIATLQTSHTISSRKGNYEGGTVFFVVSMGALKVEGTTRIFHHSASVLEATSTDEAEGMALDLIREQKPESEGWCDYSAAVTEFTPELIMKIRNND